MRKYVIMGVQGSGKGTQGALLAREFELVQIAVGDMAPTQRFFCGCVARPSSLLLNSLPYQHKALQGTGAELPDHKRESTTQ